MNLSQQGSIGYKILLSLLKLSNKTCMLSLQLLPQHSLQKKIQLLGKFSSVPITRLGSDVTTRAELEIKNTSTVIEGSNVHNSVEIICNPHFTQMIIMKYITSLINAIPFFLHPFFLFRNAIIFSHGAPLAFAM